VFNRILVVCVGNICRSPMAEALFKQALAGRNVSVSSAGLGALAGHGIEPQAQAVLEAHGLDASGHRARQIIPAMVRGADLVLVMEEWQRTEVAGLDPTARGKIHLLGRWGEFEIDDPYRQSDEQFKRTYDAIVRGVTEWTTRL